MKTKIKESSWKEKFNCFWRHKWSKWEQEPRVVITKKGNDTLMGFFMIQKRHCKVCNKLEVETK